jgi:hypothetical protein
MTHALAKICLGSMFFGGVFWLGATADASVTPFSTPFRHGGGNGSGNGKGGNRNVLIINSPNSSHDIQHIRNVNTGGNTITPTALCNHLKRNCKIIQNVWVDYP